MLNPLQKKDFDKYIDFAWNLAFIPWENMSVIGRKYRNKPCRKHFYRALFIFCPFLPFHYVIFVRAELAHFH